MWKKWLVLLSLLLSLPVLLASAQQPPLPAPPDVKPFILPMQQPPGPGTWLLGQPYGNTTGAYNFGAAWYAAGQGLHFGLDFSMPCGSPLIAMADGEVQSTDSLSYGSGPHNLVLWHPQHGVHVLYGHLLERPNLARGQQVQQGELVALSGDPDGVCTSRPHLHLEIRSENMRATYNPIDWIAAPWDSLALIGGFSYPMFQQDMDNPRRWMQLDDQPYVQFGGRILNSYSRVFPLPLDERPPDNAPLPRDLPPLPAESTWGLRQLAFGQCCAGAWWHPSNPNHFYTIDGPPGQRALVFQHSVDASAPPIGIEEAPPMLLSPDGTHQVTRVNGQVTLRNLLDGSEWTLATRGALPAISPGNRGLLWEIWKGNYLPGEPAQSVETWVSDLRGENARQIWLQRGGWAVWLDDARVLIVSPSVDRVETTLHVYDTRDDSSFTLGAWDWLRGISIAPGGEHLLFYLVFQEDPATNGLYSLRMVEGASAERLPFFGAWRWRDADSLFYIPFDLANAFHSLGYYDLASGEARLLTDPLQTPFIVANGDWQAAPDGERLLYRNALDDNLWLLERLPPES